MSEPYLSPDGHFLILKPPFFYWLSDAIFKDDQLAGLREDFKSGTGIDWPLLLFNYPHRYPYHTWIVNFVTRWYGSNGVGSALSSVGEEDLLRYVERMPDTARWIKSLPPVSYGILVNGAIDLFNYTLAKDQAAGGRRFDETNARNLPIGLWSYQGFLIPSTGPMLIAEEYMSPSETSAIRMEDAAARAGGGISRSFGFAGDSTTTTGGAQTTGIKPVAPVMSPLAIGLTVAGGTILVGGVAYLIYRAVNKPHS